MRKPRELRDGALYHVTARANRKELILGPDAIKELFLSVLKRAKNKYEFRIENFCLMGNHVHLMIRPGKGESLSAIMQWILGVFAMAYNRLNRLTGHVWGCRFYSRIIASMREHMLAFEYVDANPERASLVANRRGWPWGGLWHNRAGCRDLVTEVSAWLMFSFPEHEQLLLASFRQHGG